MVGNQWDALRASHALGSSVSFSTKLECLYDFARTYFIKNSWMMKAPPPPRSARQSQRKMFLAILFCARPISSKKERTFFFGILPSKYSGRWRGFNADSVLPNYFSGDFDLAKPRLIFPPAGGVWGGMRAGFASDFLAGYRKEPTKILFWIAILYDWKIIKIALWTSQWKRRAPSVISTSLIGTG